MDTDGPIDQEILTERVVGYRAGFTMGVAGGVLVVGCIAGLVVFAFRHCIFG